VLFGEQSDDADAWVDLVSADLEDHGYAIGTPDIPAAGFGGAHIRQRFYWVADTDNAEWWSERAPWHDGHWPKTGRVQSDRHAGYGGASDWLGHASSAGLEGSAAPEVGRQRQAAERTSGVGWMGDADPIVGIEGCAVIRRRHDGSHAHLRPGLSRPGDVDWLLCHDSTWRPVEPGTCPLVDEAPARMGRLRLYGDAIDAEAAANFIGAYLDCAPQSQAA
jgi:DNA (cytosine-5)-methyltransferase 1